MDYSPKKLIQLLEKRASNSSELPAAIIFISIELRKTIVVPMHGNRDIPKGTFMSILKQAGISKDEI